MTRPFAWLWAAPASARRALLAASLGWLLDSFDVFLYSLLLPGIMLSLHLSKSRAGLLGSATLVAAAVGGVGFGLVADRWGRTRALMASVLIYAVFTACCGLAWSWGSLLVFRVLLGLGMGGEWATGATLVSETWPAETRSRALALMQSAFALGYGLAALVSGLLQPWFGWRGVFAVGILPALLTVWVRHRVPEPESWRTREIADQPASVPVRCLFRKPLGRFTLGLTLMNALCLFAWWGFNLWVPSYLRLSSAAGGLGLSAAAMTGVLVTQQAGMWLGYVSFGAISEVWGRKRMYVLYLLASAFLLTLFASLHSPRLLTLLAPVLAFAATGYWSGFAAVTAEVYPSRIRATAQGLTYNTGRLASAVAPFAVGSLAESHGFPFALRVAAAFFLLAALVWVWIPETQGHPLARSL